MKKLQKHLLSLIAALIAVAGVWAMHGKHSNQKFDTYYYHYLGDNTTLAAYQLQSNWELLADKDAPGCTQGDIPCVVSSTQSTVQSFVSSINNKSDVESNVYTSRD